MRCRFRSWIGPALAGLRLYWPVLLGLQGAAIGIALLYWTVPAFAARADHLGVMKERAGLWFVVVAGILSGAMLPELLKACLRPPGYHRPTIADLAHLCGLIGLLTVAVDGFYRLQGWWLGEGTEWWRVVAKVAVDQLGFALFVAVPTIVLAFEWRARGYSLRQLRRVMDRRFFLDRVPPLYVPNVMVWAPALLGLYALPTGLQFLVFLMINATWCVLMVFIARRQAG